MRRKTSIFFCLLALTVQAPAQLSQNPDKFLGNITTYGSVNPSGFEYKSLWNQITCENETKWSSVQGSGRNSWNWNDAAYNYAKKNNFLFKFHTLVWGSQYPEGWFNSNLSVAERYKAIVTWMDKAKEHYPDLQMIDVVNEAVGTHQAGNPLMKESLGGGGKTGYDWLIKAFELAHERWPNAILIYNDFNTFQWDTNAYIELVRTLRDAGAPIDAYGCQSHDVNDISKSTLESTMKRIQDELKLPMYITELDINVSDDSKQKAQFESIFPLMWEADYCAGVTLWGYVYGATWVDHSGLYKNGSPRPAMTWLIDYMKTDAAKTAKSPYPGMKKEASVYVRPAALKVANGDKLPIKVRVDMATQTIEKIDLYVGSDLIATMTEAPYETEYTATSTGTKTIKAVVKTTSSATFERYARFEVLSSTTKREPYSQDIPQLPGTITMTNFDKGAAGVSYNNASRTLSETKDGAWMEYTVDVKEEGTYTFNAEIASSAGGGLFHIAEYSMDNLAFLTDFIEVGATGGNDTYKTLYGKLNIPLTAGRHVLCFNVDKGGFLIKNMTFTRTDINSNLKTTVTANPTKATAKSPVTVTVKTSPEGTAVQAVRLYADNILIEELTQAPYETQYTPAKYGTYRFSAIAIDTDGKQSAEGSTSIKVRSSYSAKPVSISGSSTATIEAEKFDKGGEGFTFHDSDSKNEGTNWRSDSEGVDIRSGNGGYAIGYTKANEWLEYAINVKEAGKYSCKATVSSKSANTSFKLEAISASGSKKSLGTITVPNTGSDDTYKTVTKTLNKTLDAGVQTLRLTIVNGGCNIDKLEFTLVESGVSYIMDEDQLLNGTRYNLGGVRVDQFNKNGITIINGKKVLIVE